MNTKVEDLIKKMREWYTENKRHTYRRILKREKRKNNRKCHTIS